MVKVDTDVLDDVWRAWVSITPKNVKQDREIENGQPYDHS